MKKLFLLTTLLIVAFSVKAQNSIYVYKSDGTTHKFLVNEVDSISFTEPNTNSNESSSGVIDNYKWINLGLPSGTKWATCNVGATTPEEYGNYYAWGEKTTKSSYTWATYKWCSGRFDTLTKYCGNYNYGSVDNKSILDPEDDAATVNWGNAWRMPTDNEWTELRTKCTWDWETQNGVNGYKITGPNGNSIFLPAAGYIYNSSISDKSTNGEYWSSSLDEGYSFGAWHIKFSSTGVLRESYNYYSSREYGRSVRPVLK